MAPDKIFRFTRHFSSQNVRRFGPAKLRSLERCITQLWYIHILYTYVYRFENAHTPSSKGSRASYSRINLATKTIFELHPLSPKRFVIARLTRVDASLISAKLEEKLGRLMKTDCRTATRAWAFIAPPNWIRENNSRFRTIAPTITRRPYANFFLMDPQLDHSFHDSFTFFRRESIRIYRSIGFARILNEKYKSRYKFD